jgi:hypothetical protein
MRLWLMKTIAGFLCVLLFEQGRALVTGQMPTLPAPLFTVFEQSSDWLRAVATVAESGEAHLVSYHPDLDAQMAAEISSLRQSPITEAKSRVAEILQAKALPQASSTLHPPGVSQQPQRLSPQPGLVTFLESLLRPASLVASEEGGPPRGAFESAEELVAAGRRAIDLARSVRGAPPIEWANSPALLPSRPQQ